MSQKEKLSEPTRLMRWLHRAIFAVLVLMVCLLWVRAFGEKNFGISLNDGRLTIRDFAAHSHFTRSFWMDGTGYDVTSHLQITSDWFGQPISHALPFGYSPTMLWLLGPLCLLPTVWAYVVWTAAGLCAVWWLTMLRRRPPIAGLLLFLSPLGNACFALGQTAILSSTGLLYLALRPKEPETKNSGIERNRVDWLSVLVLFGLTAKPPLAITGGVVLLSLARWRTVLAALLLTVAATGLLSPKLGAEWVHDYLHLITHYDRERSDPAFEWSLQPAHMSNLRAVLSVGLGMRDDFASRIATLCWVLSLISLPIFARSSKPAVVWGYALLAYLSFFPHVTSTECLVLVVLQILIWLPNQRCSKFVRFGVTGLVIAIIYFSPATGPIEGWQVIPVMFLGNLLLVGLLLVESIRSRNESPIRSTE